MKSLRNQMFLILGTVALLLAACQKEENANSIAANEQEKSVPILQIESDLATTYPIQAYNDEQEIFVKMQLTSFSNATLKTSDGKSLTGQVDRIKFFKADDTYVSVVHYQDQVFVGTQVELMVDQTVEAQTNRRTYITALCLGHSANVYNQVYDNLIQTHNVACDFCAYSKADRAFRDCMGGNYNDPATYYFY